MNGQQMQDSSTRDLIFTVPQIISFLSMSSRPSFLGAKGHLLHSGV